MEDVCENEERKTLKRENILEIDRDIAEDFEVAKAAKIATAQKVKAELVKVLTETGQPTAVLLDDHGLGVEPPATQAPPANPWELGVCSKPPRQS